jgi:hypothetical protein
MSRPSLLPLLIVLCPVLFVSPGMGQASTSVEVGKVRGLRQSATGGPEKQDEKTYKALTPQETIMEGTKVVTGSGAGAAILLNPPIKGFVQLGSNTKLAFNKWLSEVVKGERKLEVYVGRILASFWSEPESSVTIRVRQGNRSVEIKPYGTSVYLDVATDGSIFLMVLDGRVSVESQSGAPVSVSAGQQTFIAAGQAPTPPVPFNVSPRGGSDLRSLGDVVLLEPPLIDLDDPRLNLPK